MSADPRAVQKGQLVGGHAEHWQRVRPRVRRMAVYRGTDVGLPRHALGQLGSDLDFHVHQRPALLYLAPGVQLVAEEAAKTSVGPGRPEDRATEPPGDFG